MSVTTLDVLRAWRDLMADPGPDCFRHQDELVRPSRAEMERTALEHLDRLMQAQPTPAHEREAA